MSQSLKTASLNAGTLASVTTRTSALFNDTLGQGSLQRTTSFGTRSRLEIGRFDRVFSSSGSVRRNFADVFRFDLNSRRRIRFYLGNEFSSGSSSRRMVMSLLDDRTLRTIRNVTVSPSRIDAITTTLNPGTYRISISTQSNNRGRYFIDMVRV
ncbi:MAG: hypothetical protein MUF72_14550 [Elainella sp. Prado103]|jgi:hypothetical protein|nr:hypothetical protein [Elainella sp. Prado103]